MAFPKLKLPGARRTPETIQAEISEYEKVRVDAQASLDRLMQDRPGILVNGTDADLKALDDRQREQLVIIERQAAKVDALRKERVALEYGTEQAARRAAYDAAMTKVDGVRSTIEERYSAIVGDTLRLLREIAEANEAAERVNAALPDGAMPLASPETAARATPSLPSFLDEVETVERWAFADGMPVADEYLSLVVDYGGGRGSYKAHRKEGADNVETGQEVTLRRFKRVTSYPSTFGTYPSSLADVIRLPALYSDVLIWGTQGFVNFYPNGIFADLAEAEAKLATAIKPEVPTKAQRRKTIEMRPIWTEAEVKLANSPMTDYGARSSSFGAARAARR